MSSVHECHADLRDPQGSDEMDIEQLRLLLAVIDAGSLSSVARARGQQVSTLSRRVAELEREVGIPLLERTGRGVRVRPRAERFTEQARSLVHDADAALAGARGASPTAGRLRLSAPVELALQLLPPVLAEMSRAHPDLVLDVHTEARQVSLLEEDFDAALRLGRLRVGPLVARGLGEVPLVIVASPRLPGARVVRAPHDLELLPFVHVAGGPADVRARWRGRPVLVRTRARVRVSTFTEAAALVRLGVGAAVLPGYAAHALHGAVRLLPGLVLPDVPLALVYPPRLRGSVALRDLGDRVAAALASARRDLAGRPRPRGDLVARAARP